MEMVEQVASIPNKDLSPIAKGKRTKRHRTHSPIPFTTRPPTTNHRRIPSFSASSTSEDDSTTTEEENTARCLILLAQGGHCPNRPQKTIPHVETTTTTTTTGKPAGGACLYTCKTCNRAFPSFQALGGHRASHKKPKNEKKSSMFSDEEDFPSPSSISSLKNRLSLQLSNISPANLSGIPKASPSPRIHECSYCGAEFTSGQALGGHMRRHRGSGPVSPSVNRPATPIELKNTRNFLSLDLNLPAPEEENHRFGFPGSRQLQMKSPERKQGGERLAFPTTPSLLDCQY